MKWRRRSIAIPRVLWMKEWMIEMAKTIERVDKTVQMIADSKEKDGSLITIGSTRTMKEKEGEKGESSQAKANEGDVDRSKYKHLEMPIFSGEHPNSWVFRAEHYFGIHELSNAEKIKVAIIAFVPNKVDWFHWTH